MKKQIKIATLFAVMSMSFGIAQEKNNEIETVVVSETKFPIKKEKSGKTIEKITQKDLEAKPGQSVAQVLNQLAGVDINGANSASGKDLGYYIRGGRSNQVLIMIDGVPVTDASQIAPVYDLRLLPSEQVESIEVMKGASSVQYGSNASNAVINITLKKASQKKLQGNAYLNFGTQNTSKTARMKPQDFAQGISVNGTLDKVSYFTSVNSVSTKGISQAKGDDFENDSFNRVNLLQKFGFKATEKWTLDIMVNYDRTKNTFDAGALADDKLNNSLTDQVRFTLNNKFNHKFGELFANLSYGNTERSLGLFNSFGNTLDQYYYKSRQANIDVFNRFQIGKYFQTVLGTQFQFMDMIEENPFGQIENNNAKFNVIDPYASLIVNAGGFNFNGGVRLNTHSVYKPKPVFNFNPSFYIESIRLKLLASASTAYITPSLYQLYSPYANLDLKPQEDFTGEFGFEKSFLNKKLSVFAVGFYRQEKNRIDFFSDNVNFIYKYINIEDIVNARGIEAKIDINPVNNVSLQTNYTFTEVEEEQARLIAKHRFNANIGIKLSSKITWNAQYQYVDKRNDLYFNPQTFSTESKILDAYQLVNTNFNIELTPKMLNVFFGVQNILDKEFAETFGYNTLGRNFKIGLNLNF